MWPQEDITCLVEQIIKNLYDDHRLSDLTVRLKDGSTLQAHRFVLASRSKVWFNQYYLNATPNSLGSPLANSNTNSNDNNNNNGLIGATDSSSLSNNSSILANDNQQSTISQSELDLSEVDPAVAKAALTWIYTGVFEFDDIFQDEQFVFGVMKIARKYKLSLLINQCEKSLLAMAPTIGLDKVARLLMEGQANMNTKNDEGLTLLHLAIINGDEKGAVYLLQNSADIHIKTPNNQSALELAVRHKLPQVVRAICQKDYDFKNTKCSNGDPPIWLALSNRDENIASILVEYNCDTNCWQELPAKYSQNLLHRALDQSDEQIACFLIRSGCDCNSPRKPLENGEGDEEAFDGQTPLHIACAWGMLEVVQTLLEHHADINAQDAEGRTPLHIAIINHQDAITNLLVGQQQLDLKLRDKYGQNAFAAAMSTKNNKAATTILGREPHAAEKYDPKGRTFLHLAILKNDIESVLFLLSVRVNVHSRVQDSSKFTPLHLAVQVGSEMILRNLLLAGSNINDVTVQNQSALHIAAAHNHHQLCSILLENNIKFDMVDSDLNNALHIACQNGHLDTCRVLLTESRVNAEAVNLKGQNPLHLLAQHGKENAHAIFTILIESEPKYPLDNQDAEGNTPFLLAFMNGNANLCRALLRHKIKLGTVNKNGTNIFNANVASKSLLYRLLEYLPLEPQWTNYDSCLECKTKFSTVTRKHHCRHCGRILCAKCSSQKIAITKFNSTEPVRVCGTCVEVLTYGETHTN